MLNRVGHILSVPVPNGKKQAVLRAASLFLRPLKQALSEAQIL